jgi:purine nucleoside phosphorylase
MSPSEKPEDPRVTAEFLKNKLSPELQKVEILVICGSGLSGLANLVEPDSKVVIPYEVRFRVLKRVASSFG